MLINSGKPTLLSGTVPKVSAYEPMPFHGDGFVFPRPVDVFFDVFIHVEEVDPGATELRIVFTQEERIKSGLIRGIGYGYDSAYAYFDMVVTLLIGGGTPARYIFKTVDEIGGGPGSYNGSLPPTQIGTLQNPTPVFIDLPSNTQVDLQFVNNSANLAFQVAVRLTGWDIG